MAWSLRSSCVGAALVTGAAFAASAPATAQFFNPFEALFGQPPRPPSTVPAARPQAPASSYPQYQDLRSDQGYQPQPYPNETNVPRRPPAGVSSAPLAPPPGGTTASVDTLPGLPEGQQQLPRGTQQPADTSPQPGDEVITEPPAQKIENKGAVFSGLDKITGRIINFDAAIGETVQFGALQVTPRVCYTRPPTEKSNTDAFIEVAEVTLQGEVKRIFSGWMFAASPGLHGVEHPIYDVWLTDCKNPVIAAAPPAETSPAADAPSPTPAKPAAPQRRSGQQQARPSPQAFPPH
ncbi:MAG TPA: DUF2155 domain-containing protein [Xanthobacteraceae bacterium]|jgi:hypothetical protein